MNHNFIIGATDTDSTSFCKQDGSPFSKEEIDELILEINEISPEFMIWEHDGYYKKVLIIKAKNYCLLDQEDKLKIRGSALLGSMKEPALKEFMKEIIDYLLNDKKDEIVNLYHKYIVEIHHLTDIKRWSSKKTLTASVLNPKRTNEQNLFNAIKGKELQAGDKFLTYFTKDGSVKTPEDWSNDQCTLTLMSKLYKTLEIFETVLQMTSYTKFTLKSHEVQVKLAQLLGLPEPEKKTRKKKEVEV